MEEIKKNILDYWWFNLFLVLILASWLFYISQPEGYVKINQASDVTDCVDKTHYIINQSYEPPEIDKVENVMKNVLKYFRPKEICFADKGSKITAPEAVNDLIVSVTYNDITNKVAQIFPEEEYVQELNYSCFKIVDEEEIMWEWKFSSSLQFSDGFVQICEKDRGYATISPKVATYLKTSKTFYAVFIFLCLFYSGIFWWAITRICKFINKGFKDIK